MKKAGYTVNITKEKFLNTYPPLLPVPVFDAGIGFSFENAAENLRKNSPEESEELFFSG